MRSAGKSIPSKTLSGSQEKRVSEPSFALGTRVAFALFTMLLLLIGGGGWAATANLASAIIAPGSLVVERHVKKVQHRDGGIVSEINVKNGDFVLAGDVVLRLDDTQTRAELGVVRSQLMELSGRRVRLIAERDGLTTLEFPNGLGLDEPEAENVIRGERRLFEGNRTTRESQKTQLNLRIEQLKEEINGLGAQRDAKMGELALIQKELAQVKGLAEQGLTPISRVYAMEREATRLGGEHGGLIAQIARANGQISEINLQIISVDQQARTDAQRELRAIEGRIAELMERRVAAQDRLNRMELRAPQSGIIHELAVHTVGGIVTPAEPVMLIVPGNDVLTVEARVAPTDIDQVAVSQEVHLRFSAFNQRTTPELLGRVAYVSADVTHDPRGTQSYYLTRIEIDPTTLALLGDVKLQPGMPVEAFIATGERTALSYFVKPLTDHFARAMREN